MVDTQKEKIIPIYIEDEVRDSYLNYAMSVIVGRALPEVRDGLKPVHRRVLYSMQELGLEHNKPFKKSARIVGTCLGQYHPHGDMAVYDTLVRMAQDFSLRYPLVEGQGNFGCFTKDTKIRLTDGRNLSFKQLIEETKQGKKNYTFTFNHRAKKIEIAEIKEPRLTRKNAEIIKVTLDSDQEIKCTPDHLFMLRDGTYKKAKDLKPQDSLMPLYLDIYNGNGNPNLKGYEIIYQPLKCAWEFTHHLVDKWNLENKLSAKTKLTPELYEHRRPSDLPQIKKAPKYFSGLKDMVIQAQQLNHKVKKIEFLNRKEDVYDLTVEPWHNFGLACGVFVHNSIDGDAPAAMRYTEARLAAISDEVLGDLDKDTVDFMPNFDASLVEPRILPAKLPNLLVNGSSGIAVGMATNMPPHNLVEVLDAVIYLLDNPEAETKDLMRYIKGPDFPTGGLICGKEGIKEAYNTGKGKLILRARVNIERQKGGRDLIVINEIPYQVNKANLIESIAGLVEDKKIEGISDIRDESDKEGIRMVVELKRDTEPQIILNQLYKYTQLETTFGVINLALVEGRPRVLNLKQLLQYYIEHRKEIIRRRTKFELDKALKRAHILEGLKIALKFLDKVIKTIRSSKDTPQAKEALMKNFDLSAEQSQAILEMQLQRLTALERDKLEAEYLDLIKKIELYKSILASEKKIEAIIKDESQELKKKYGDERRTEIVGEVEEIEIEDLIAEEDMVITISNAGYIKRLSVSAYRKQKRGGRGVTAMETREEDFVKHLFVASTKDYLLIFTNRGKVYWLKVYEIPEASRIAKGKAIVNLLSLASDEVISSVVSVKEFSEDKFLIMCTKKGIIKKTRLSEFSNPRKAGVIAVTLEKDDALVEAQISEGKYHILLASKAGKSIRFKEEQVRDMGRLAKGVGGFRIDKKDEVIGMEVFTPEIDKRKDLTLLSVTALGFAKRSNFDEYRLQSRGGKGIINLKVTPKNGQVVSLEVVSDDDEVMAITQKGMIVRCPVKDIRATGPNTQGVRLISLEKDDSVTAIAKVVTKEEE